MTGFDARSYWERRLGSSRGLEGVGYIGLGQAFNAWMYRVRRWVFRRTIRRYMPSTIGAKVLDVGSGTGEYLRSWSHLGVAAVTGVDLTDAAVSRLQKDHPGMEIYQSDITDHRLSFDGTYDAVSCMDVLFHVMDDDALQRALHNLRAALRTGGLLFFSENFLHEVYSGEQHFTQRSLETYRHMLQAAGFRILERRPMFHLMNYPVDARSPWLHRWWTAVLWLCERSARAGGALAMAVYPLELLIISLRQEGVSTELMVCEAMPLSE